MKKYCLYVILLFSQILGINAQSPVAFELTSEEGLPSQTIYSTIQDKKGFIWIGTDAGLYRYDGIRYYEYKHPLQKSRSLTGLEKAIDGKIYMYNFNGQIFYIENDSLKLLNAWDKGSVSNICIDKNSNLWVSYSKGITTLSIKTNKWSYFATTPKYPTGNFTHSCYIDKDNVFWCIGPKGLIQIDQGVEKCYHLSWSEGKASGDYQLTYYSKQKFIFSRVDGEIFRLMDGNIKPFYSNNLNPILKDKKITRVEEDNQDRIWIYTYSGIIIYDIKHDTSELLYEDKSFSCGIQDNENSYWFSTLHDGLLRIPELSNKLWIIKDDANGTAKINKIVRAKSSVFFASVNGKIGELKLHDNTINTISLDTKSDIQSFTLAEDSQSVLFGIQVSVFNFKQNKTKIISEKLPPAKDVLQIGNNYIVASSKGTFWYCPDENSKTEVLNEKWARSIAYNKIINRLWVATNSGIDVYQFKNNHWIYITTLLDGIQIISLSYKSKLHALAFNGNVYEIENNRIPHILTTLNQNTTSYQLKENDSCLFAATNKGLWIYNLKNKEWQLKNRLSGLASNNIDALAVDDKYIWLATSKGVMQIPLQAKRKTTHSKIYLKNIFVNNSIIKYNNALNLEYKDELKIELEAVALSSENQFQYAYRLNYKNSWIFLPAEINQIELPVLSSGPFNLEIKLVDHLGKDSINSVLINGTVNPPFWQRWWFYLMIGITCLLLALFIFKQRVKVIHKKQIIELERINLEHQLKLSKETALRAQMNPHFIFNVLNSIKSFIYENDKKNAASYLQRFSDLIRKILEQSSVSWVKLDEEIELLKLYIELEAMMLSEKLEYELQIDDNIDTNHISIPSLMMQPFIENAFKHGLRHATGNKKLHVAFSKVNDLLSISITDNGIGRDASQKINSQNDKKYQSFSTNAIDRMATINKGQAGIVSIIYTDIKDEKQNSQGTKVTVNIRYHE